MPTRIVTGWSPSRYRRPQPDADTSAAATTTTRTSQRRCTVRTSWLRLSAELVRGASGHPRRYDFATGGSSSSHGHAAIVLTLPLLFLMTVIFMWTPEKRLFI